VSNEGRGGDSSLSVERRVGTFWGCASGGRGRMCALSREGGARRGRVERV